MKTLALFLVVLGMLAVPVFADEAGNNTTDNNTTQITNDSVVEEDVGSLPGEFGYGFKRFFENVDKFFTFNKAELAKKHARYGKIRAIEAHLMSGKAQQYAAMGDEEAAQKALEIVEQLTAEQNEESNTAESELEAAVDDGSADEGDVAEVQNEVRNSIMVLQRVYEKVPESAKDGVLNALNNSIRNHERHMEKMEEQEEKKLGRATDDDEDEENETVTGQGNGPNGQGNDNVDKGNGPKVHDDDENETVGHKGKGPNGQGNDDDEDELENETED